MLFLLCGAAVLWDSAPVEETRFIVAEDLGRFAVLGLYWLEDIVLDVEEIEARYPHDEAQSDKPPGQ